MTDRAGSAGTLVDQARAALEAHQWRAALDAMTAADEAGPLAPDELELLASAAWWMGQMPVAIEARERAYAAAVKAGDMQTATIEAISLARDNMLRLSLSVAGGWLKRAEQLLEDQDEGPAHGWLAVATAFHRTFSGDHAEALSQAIRAVDIGRRFGVREIEVTGLSQQGAVLLGMGRVQEGLALADEATAAAVSGELQPQTAGGVCCTTIESCSGIGDMRRAAEWTEAQDRWCRREGINGFPGMCRLFRSEVKCLRGAWPEAEAEALVAADELRGFMPGAAGLAWYQIGEIRLRRGDLPAAEEALLSGHALGQDPEPLLSLLRLEQGRVAEAAAGIRRAVEEPTREPSWKAPPNSAVARLHLLPAMVEIMLEADDVAAARVAADRLAELAGQFGTTTARARAAAADGSVALAEGRAADAAQRLREAISGWTEIDAPYELARARMTLARALRVDGAAGSAALEVRAARATFEALGAALDLRRADEMLDALQADAGQLPVGMATTRVTRTLMFTDIVDSTRLAEQVGDDAWDRIIRWHDRTLRSAAAAQGGVEVKATGDGLFLAFAEPGHAIEAATVMQQRLNAEAEGDAEAASNLAVRPQVRIGIHQAEVNRVGLDYVGTGVNVAARIGAAAGPGEIVVSAATLDAARNDVRSSARRTLELKGISTPVEVATVDWR